MNEMVLANRAADWRRLKMLVLDSVSSPMTKRVYNLGLDEFFQWYGREPRPGFTKATVSAWRERRLKGGGRQNCLPHQNGKSSLRAKKSSCSTRQSAHVAEAFSFCAGRPVRRFFSCGRHVHCRDY
jgi:hypothetical protein